MNIGTQIPFRRGRMERRSSGSLILDRQREMYLRDHKNAPEVDMKIWSKGHFSRA